MKLRELFEARMPTSAELAAATGDADDDMNQMSPHARPMSGAASTPFTVMQAITSVLGGQLVTNDEDELTAENHMDMVYVWNGSREGFFIPTEDGGTGGSIEVQDMDSQEAGAVAVGVHEAFHALFWRKTGGQGNLVSQEKIVNRAAEKWLKQHLTGMALHVALEHILGSKISYGPNHMPKPAPEDLRELFEPENSLPLEWEHDGTFSVARAYDRQGRLIEVSFTCNADGMMDIEFTRGGSMDTTGHGDEQIVFTTVITALRQFMAAHKNVNVIYFGGAADRQRLYSMLAHRLGKEYGFHRAARPSGSVFKMVRNPA